MGDDPVSLEDSLDHVVRSLRGAGAKATAGVFGQWEDVVGVHVAAHARPALLDAGRLVIEVDQPGWATQLRFLETELLERLTAVAGPGAVRSIEVRVRRSSAPPKNASP
jgi:predicted nucleic acid-binding Zn ribbon protein